MPVVGAPHYLLFSRYATLWQELVTALDLEWQEATPDNCLASLESRAVQKSLDAVAGINFQLFCLELHALAATDALLLPSLNIEEHTKGSGQNPWIASLDAMVNHQFPKLPRGFSIPARGYMDRDTLEPIVVKTLLDLMPNAALVRRSWERQKLKASQKPRSKEPIWRVVDKKTVAVVAQPWLLTDLPIDVPALLAKHTPQTTHHFVWQHDMTPYHMRQEGWALDAKLLATDAEVLGAARLFARKEAVESVVFISDASQPSDAWLARRLEQLTHKPVRNISLQQLISNDDVEASNDVDYLRYILGKAPVPEISQETSQESANVHVQDTEDRS